jgi:single-stranded-DNA-specific exonuclease
MEHRWQARHIEDTRVVEQLSAELNQLPLPLARALVLRGIDTFEKSRLYFRPSLADLHDPFLMKDMDRAVDRLKHAIQRSERVMVYGDYDVDGTTATTLMTMFLRRRGVDVSYFVPHRIEHGYGLSRAGIDEALDRGVTLIVALDCGITAIEEARYAGSLGIDLVVCDHHTVNGEIPAAVAVLDPKRPDCPYPYDELSGCGIGFKLAQATSAALGEAEDEVYGYLDLVAVSIASDIVPMTGENRVLMREGLKKLHEKPSRGFRALARHAAVDLKSCSTSQILFSLGPRINAAGRLGDAGRAVDLMLAEDDWDADRIASVLESTNDRRRTIDRETVEEAVEAVEQLLEAADVNSIVLHNAQWHPGVIGIVASRLVEQFVRPTILLTTIDGLARGSARSVNGVNIYDAIRSCEDLVEEFGGHDYAAGLSIREDRIAEFRARFDRAVAELASEDSFVPSIDYDSTLGLDQIDDRFWAILSQFAPHGPSNRTPVFRASQLQVLGRPRTVGRDEGHLAMTVRQEGSRPIPVIGFGLGERLDTVLQSREESRPLEMLFSIQERTWNGTTALQLKAKDIRLEP